MTVGGGGCGVWSVRVGVQWSTRGERGGLTLLCACTRRQCALGVTGTSAGTSGGGHGSVFGGWGVRAGGEWLACRGRERGEGRCLTGRWRSRGRRGLLLLLLLLLLMVRGANDTHSRTQRT